MSAPVENAWRPWTIEGLGSLWAILGTGATLDAAAVALGRMRGECDLASWALVGRTPEQALSVVNRQARRPLVERGVPARLRRFLEGMFSE